MVKYLIVFQLILFAPAAYARDTKIFAICYGTDKIIIFNNAGAKSEITEKHKMLLALQQNADFMIEGRLSGNDYSPAQVLPTVFYLHGSCNVPYFCKYPKNRNHAACSTFNAHPEWKMKAHGEQLFRLGYECFEVMDIANPAYQDFMGYHIKKVLDTESFFKGVMLDETSGHFNSSVFGFHKTHEQSVVEPVDKEVMAIRVKNTMNQSNGSCSSVLVKKTDGTLVRIQGIWHTAKTIYLTPTVHAGEQVTAIYYSNSADWPVPTDAQWTAWTTALLARIRKSTKTGLIIYNGTMLGYNYDMQFLKYADGCVREGFVSGNPSVTQWKADLDRLADISRGKMYFAYTEVNNAGDQETLRHMWFAYASFLLGNNGNGYFSIWNPRTSGPIFHAGWNQDTGKPLEDYRQQSNAVYVREYEYAYAAVNMGEKTEKVTIPSAFENQATVSHQRRPFHLEPKCGLVLYRNKTN